MATSYMNSVASTLLKRKSPLTVEAIAERTGASEKWVRNCLTEDTRIASWMPANHSVVRLTRGRSNQYCVRKDSELRSTIKAGGRNWSQNSISDYKASYSA